jgi:hypothetical protein
MSGSILMPGITAHRLNSVRRLLTTRETGPTLGAAVDCGRKVRVLQRRGCDLSSRNARMPLTAGASCCTVLGNAARQQHQGNDAAALWKPETEELSCRAAVSTLPQQPTANFSIKVRRLRARIMCVALTTNGPMCGLGAMFEAPRSSPCGAPLIGTCPDKIISTAAPGLGQTGMPEPIGGSVRTGRANDDSDWKSAHC